MTRGRSILLAALCLSIVLACAGSIVPSPTVTPSAFPSTASVSLSPSRRPSSEPSPSRADVELARKELDRLVSSLELIHPEPYHGVSREEFIAAIEALSADLPSLTPFEAQVGLQRVVAMLSREGRDGHQFAMPPNDVEAPALPISVYEFDDGVFVTAAMDPYAELVGSRIVALGDAPIDEVLAALEPLVPRDGPATVPGFRPTFMLRTSVLRGLGLIGEGPVEITTTADGHESATALEPVGFREWLAWKGGFGIPALPSRDDTIYLSDPTPMFWSQFLAASGIQYIRYEQVAVIEAAALDDAFQRAVASDVAAVVLDLRQNPGGDNNRYVGLLQRLRDPRVDRPGRLFVLIDRLTFSAASNLATEIEQSTGAIFAGEPMGGGLNFWDDVSQVRLSDYVVPMDVGVSTRFWQKSSADDPRLTIEPDIRVPVLSTDYFAGRDPVLDEVANSL